MMTDFRAELQALVDASESFAEPVIGHRIPWQTALDRARAALAEPAPALAGNCPACEGTPKPGNQPCAVCGRPAPAPAEGEVVPGASDTRYEFSVVDEGYAEQAGGSAPTYTQALREGQQYLAVYLQDGPHTLELRRVEILDPDALPLPQAGEDVNKPPLWQPIDTAPKDGTEILASDYDAIEIVSWKVYANDSDWESRWGDRMFPGWWQPLPDHPPMPPIESD